MVAGKASAVPVDRADQEMAAIGNGAAVRGVPKGRLPERRERMECQAASGNPGSSGKAAPDPKADRPDRAVTVRRAVAGPDVVAPAVPGMGTAWAAPVVASPVRACRRAEHPARNWKPGAIAPGMAKSVDPVLA